MDFRTIVAQESPDGWGTITLNRPDRRNAISIEMRREISACLRDWASSPRVGAVIFTGAGAGFSGGFDLKEFSRPELFDELLETSTRYHLDVWRFPKPTIAAVHGAAMGGGFDLAVFCDLRIAAEDTVFGHPEVKLGAPPLYTPLRWIVGSGPARELCLTGRKIDAAEALRMGLLSEVVPAGRLLQRAGELAAEILRAPSETLRFTKAMFTAAEGSFDECFRLEHDRAFRELLLRPR
jgi:enoyl-CoA hydratase